MSVVIFVLCVIQSAYAVFMKVNKLEIVPSSSANIVEGSAFTVNIELGDVDYSGSSVTLDVRVGLFNENISGGSDDKYMYDLAQYNSTTFYANQTWSKSFTRDCNLAPGSYSIGLRGQVPNSNNWFWFQTNGSSNPVGFTVLESPRAQLSETITVPSQVTIGSDYNFRFAIREVRGTGSVSFNKIVADVCDSGNGKRYTAAEYSNVIISAGQTWRRTVYDNLNLSAPGNYKIIIKGQVDSGDSFFEFESTSGNNFNRKGFEAITPNDPPTVYIDNPDSGDTITSVNNNITVSGRATDDNNSYIERVQVRVNSGTWQTASGTTNWSISIGLVQGSNTIEARAKDSLGEYSSVVSISVTYAPPQTNPEIQLRHGSNYYDSGDLCMFTGDAYGNVVVGQYIDNTFTIRNTGDANLTLGNISETSSYYRVISQPASSVAPGGSTTFTLRFEPTNSGTKDVSISFSSNDPNNSNFGLIVRGRAITPQVTLSNLEVLGRQIWYQLYDVGTMMTIYATVSGDVNYVDSINGLVKSSFTNPGGKEIVFTRSYPHGSNRTPNFNQRSSLFFYFLFSDSVFF